MRARVVTVLVATAAPIGAAVALAATGGGGEAAGSGSGIRGAVFVTDPCTGRPTGDPRSRCPVRYHPLRAAVRIRAASSDLVRTVRSRRDGRFRVRLEPGEYTVTALRGRIGEPPPARSVTVAAGRYTDLILDYDTLAR
jgi:hypothetical protein